MNATGPRASEYASGKPAVDLPGDEFMVPVDTVLKVNFITASAAARQMLRQGSGVIIFVTGSPAKPCFGSHGRIGRACRGPSGQPAATAALPRTR